MCGLYLLVIFIFLGVDGKLSIDPNGEKNDFTSYQPTSPNPRNSSTIEIDLGLKAEEIVKLDRTLNNLAKNLLGPDLGPLSLKSTGDGKTGLIATLRKMGDAISGKLKSLPERFGLDRSNSLDYLNNSPHDYNNPNHELYYQFLRIPLIISPIVQQVHKKMKDHFRKSDYAKMGYKSSRVAWEMNYEMVPEQLKISSIFGTAANYGNRAYECIMERKPKSFDLKRAIGDLTNSSPEKMRKRLKNRLEKPIPKNPGKNREYDRVQALLCRVGARDAGIEYSLCLQEMKRIHKCINDRHANSSKIEDSSTKLPSNFLRTIKIIDDSCKNVDQGINSVVACKMKSKANGAKSFNDFVDFFLGNSKKSPQLDRMTKQVGSMIANNPMTSEALREVVALMKIWKHGDTKKARLMKAVARNVVDRSIFGRLSNALTRYKKYLYDASYSTVSKFNSIMMTTQKFLVDTASTIMGEDITANVKVLRSWTGFGNSVVTEWRTNGEQFPALFPRRRVIFREGDQGQDGRSSRVQGLIKVSTEVDFPKGPYAKRLDELMVSTKHLEQSSRPRRKSALVSIANTFLLATMFYECLVLLAGAMYQNDNTPMSSSFDVEIDRSDRHSPRDRGTPSPIDRDDRSQTSFHQPRPSSTTVTASPWHPTMIYNANSDHEKTQESVGIPSDEQGSHAYPINDYGG